MSYVVEYMVAGRYALTIRNKVMYSVTNKRKVGKSLDWGKTWRDFPFIFPYDLQSIFVSKEGVLLACASGKIYRSLNDGVTWDLVFTSTLSPNSFTGSWGWGQSPNGTIFAGEYGNVSKCLYLWRSFDLGLTWTRLDNFYHLSDWHVHQCKVNRNTGRVYLTIGDSPKKMLYSDDDGDTWTEIFTDRLTGFTGLTQTDNARFFSDDLAPGNNHIWKTTDDINIDSVYTPDVIHNTQSMFIVAYGNNELWATAYNEYQLEGNKSTIFNSIDGGVTWSVVTDSPNGGDQYINPTWGWDGSVPEYCPYFFCQSKQNSIVAKIQRKTDRFALRPFLEMANVDGPQLSQKYPVPIF